MGKQPWTKFTEAGWKFTRDKFAFNTHRVPSRNGRA